MFFRRYVATFPLEIISFFTYMELVCNVEHCLREWGKAPVCPSWSSVEL